MTNLLSSMKSAARKRAAYLRTKAEIEAMPLDVALDLNIYRGDADKIAWTAVYG